jgi:hypothetical protein
MLLAVLFVFALRAAGVAKEPEMTNQEMPGIQKASVEAAVPAGEVPSVQMTAPSVEEEQPVKGDLITLDFKEANIRDVLKVISYKSGVNIVASPEVTGTVNVRITDVPWEKAMDVILKTYGYAYDKQGNIIMVAPLEKLTAQRKMEQDLAQVQPVMTEVVGFAVYRCRGCAEGHRATTVVARKDHQSGNDGTGGLGFWRSFFRKEGPDEWFDKPFQNIDHFGYSAGPGAHQGSPEVH